MQLSEMNSCKNIPLFDSFLNAESLIFSFDSFTERTSLTKAVIITMLETKYSLVRKEINFFVSKIDFEKPTNGEQSLVGRSFAWVR